MAEWLAVVAAQPRRSGSPLDIIRVYEGTNMRNTFLEVPLCYDLLRAHDFCDGIGRISVGVDGRACLPRFMRETNGNCLLDLDWDWQPPRPSGVHKVYVEFLIWPSAYTQLYATGSVRIIAFDDKPILQ